ncbi:thiol-disulfide oxidoreductase DCC family protein [Gynuella sunshinyii]|uniref:thiol-disulfide oxidoreductase DCC family protein n=1 Tax=Gynuella sunshinyii TaxID=1445505 RepID=UPI0005CBEA18|nr:DCC1-like thiol-disulfide oxidoreductase family protein [Gynuella sunshinyii]
MENTTQQPCPLIVFDGVCVLCHAAVRFIDRHDSRQQLKVVPLQSELGQYLQQQFDINLLHNNTIMVISESGVFTRSAALFAIAGYLDRPWCWLRGFRWLPRGLNDCLYEQLARRRYRLFGRYEQCRMPALTLRTRLLENIEQLDELQSLISSARSGKH